MKKAPHEGILLIVLVYLCLGIAYGVVVPPFENLDEIEHFEVIRYLAEKGRLPAHGTPEAEDYHFRQEASQPPLYYLLSAGLVRVGGMHAGDVSAFLQLNPRVACGPDAPHLYDNRSVLYHDPHAEAFPWRGTLRMLHVLRIWSTLLQAVTVGATFAIGRRIFTERPYAPLVGAAVVAFNPQFLLVASGVNNDNLVTPLASLVLLLSIRTWQEGRLSVPRALVLGLLCGAAGLSKLSGWLTLAPCAVVALTLWLRPGAPRLRLPLVAALIPLTALAFGSWWLWRNWQLYGDLTALKPMLELVGSRENPASSISQGGLMFRSFWGQIPCSFYPSGFYRFYALLTAGGLLGLLRAWPGASRSERGYLTALGGWFLLITGSWLRWDMMTPAPGGRLLFPALPAVALLLGRGLVSVGRRRVVAPIAVVLLAGAAWWTGHTVLPGFFAPPPRYAAASAPRPAYPLEATFGEEIRLLGYDAAFDARAYRLEVTLYWQALERPGEDYLLALQLVSPVSGDNTLRWNYNSWPGRGTYPTGAWQAGTVIEDRYRFDLPPADFPTQAWEAHLALYHEETGERLPVRVDDAGAGDHLALTQIRLPGAAPECPEEQLKPEALLGGAVRLTHAAVAPGTDTTTVVLCWEALQSLPTDYTVFVHLVDAGGDLVATGDGPPAGGAFPTSLWEPGDIVRDVHTLPAAVPEGGQIVVGMYKPADGSRLPAQRAGEALPGDAVPITGE